MRASAKLFLASLLLFSSPAYSTDDSIVASSLLLDTALAGTRVVAVGEQGQILLSDDGARTWRRASAPASSLLTALSFPDDKHGWAVGHDGVVLATVDGGEQWSLQRAPGRDQRPLFDVLFTDSNHGAAVGAFGTILMTDNGGQSWRTVAGGEDDPHLYALAWDGRRLVTGGETGRLMVSTNDGASWSIVPSPFNGTVFTLLPLSDGGWMAAGFRGLAAIAPSDGFRWKKTATGTDRNLVKIRALPHGKVVLAGAKGTVVLIDAASGSATVATLPGKPDLAAMTLVDDKNFVFVGDSGAARRSLGQIFPNVFMDEKESE